MPLSSTQKPWFKTWKIVPFVLFFFVTVPYFAVKWTWKHENWSIFPKLALTVFIITTAIVFNAGLFGGDGANKASPTQDNASDALNNLEDATLPGLTAADITLNFKNQGFECQDMQIGVTGGATWTCTKKSPTSEFIIQVFGESPTFILSVQATALNYGTGDTDDLTMDFLAYTATTPFEGSEPENASAWVESNIGKNVETEFGGVNFDLVANERTRMLTIVKDEGYLIESAE